MLQMPSGKPNTKGKGSAFYYDFALIKNILHAEDFALWHNALHLDYHRNCSQQFIIQMLALAAFCS